MTGGYRRCTVPVAGGELTVGCWGESGPVVLALHGVTASHRCWPALGRRLDGFRVVAPDLRGRGGSAELPGPYGMTAHAADGIAVLDALDATEPVTVLGHSMGGFAALVLADRYPERVARLVLVDGGPPLPAPPVAGTPEEQLAAVIGPAAERLSRRFTSREEYRDFWRAHPAFDTWTDDLQSYVDYDLVGTEPDLHSRVSLAAVRGDSIDLFGGAATREAWQRLRPGAVLLRAERGMLAEPVPLYPDESALSTKLTVRTVAGTNHYTIVLGPTGAAAIADEIRAAR